MLNWLVSFWRKIEGWLHGRTVVPNTYQRSNLHGRLR